MFVCRLRHGCHHAAVPFRAHVPAHRICPLCRKMLLARACLYESAPPDVCTSEFYQTRHIVRSCEIVVSKPFRFLQRRPISKRHILVFDFNGRWASLWSFEATYVTPFRIMPPCLPIRPRRPQAKAQLQQRGCNSGVPAQQTTPGVSLRAGPILARRHHYAI